MYVLDTDICSYLMKRTQPALIERVKTFAPRDLKVSVITLFELEYGILRSDRRDSLRRVVQAFLENVELLVWTPQRAKPVPSGLSSQRRAIRSAPTTCRSLATRAAWARPS